MNIGLKTYPADLQKTVAFTDLFDFIEVMVPPDVDVSFFSRFDFKMNIHVAHERYGFNPADKKQSSLNERLVQKALEAADLVGAEYIVIHPGYSVLLEDKTNSLDFFDSYFDKRMLLENCPVGAWQKHFFFSEPKEMEEFISRYNTSFLFDVGHAILSANNLHKNVFELVKEFSDLNPKAHHIYGTDINSILTEHHKHFHQIQSDYSYISLLNPQSIFTLETDWVSKSTRGDYEKNISFLKSFFPVEEKEVVKE
jgi:sugar phosphate isomerase/epimerase